MGAVADLTSVEALIFSGFAAGLRPDPTLSVDEWADTYRILSPVASAAPTAYRTGKTPYAREPMRELSQSSRYERCVFEWGAQTGKTEIINNWLGSIIHMTPGPVLLVEPNGEMLKKVSKQRIAPMIESTPVLRGLVRESRSRDSGNTLFQKDFPGGTLMLASAQSAANLRSMPIRFLAMDEVDAYQLDVDREGSPVDLAEARTVTFRHGRKMCYASTSGIRGLSLIRKLMEESDRRRYCIPCPACGHMDWLQFKPNGYYGNEGIHHYIHFENRDPSTACMVCSGCGEHIAEGHKNVMLDGGEWRKTLGDDGKPVGDGRTAGFHLSALYSPLGWKQWSECVEQFLKSADDPPKLQVFVNTVLAEPWEEKGSAADPNALRARRYDYGADVPAGVGVLVGSVDVQGDRLEAQITGFGAGEESWLIAYTQILKDPQSIEAWSLLDEFLLQPFRHASGRRCFVECVTVDTGYHADQVYRYCKARLASGRRVYPIKGDKTHGKPLLARPSIHNRYHVPLFMLCVNTGKETIMARLTQVLQSGPGHFHLSQSVADDEYIEQLTAEKSIRRWVPGKGLVKMWEQTRPRNEALDCTVYALAAVRILGLKFMERLGERAREWARVDGVPLELQLDDEAASVGQLDEEPAAAPETPEKAPEIKQILRRAGRGTGWGDF